MKIPPPISQFAEALTFLTRYPLPRRLFSRQPAGAKAAWAFPIAGVLAAALPALFLAALLAVAAGPLLAALLALTVYALVTGGLHQDGLADSADGLLGGRDRGHALEIMKDSRIGSFGVLALMFLTGIKAASLADISGSGDAPAMFVAAAAVGRAAMVFHWHALPAARTDGVARRLGQPAVTETALAILSAIVVMLLAGGAIDPIRAMGIAALATALTTGLFSVFVRRRIAGHTGDTLGATAEIGETTFLTALVIFL